MARGDPQIKVRLPQDVKEFIERQSEYNASSQTSEIVRCIRDKMRRIKNGGGDSEIGVLISTTENRTSVDALDSHTTGKGTTDYEYSN